MNHKEIVHKYIDPVLNKYNASVEEIAADWRKIKPERKRELAKCVNECLSIDDYVVWVFFASLHKNASDFTAKIRRWSS